MHVLKCYDLSSPQINNRSFCFLLRKEKKDTTYQREKESKYYSKEREEARMLYIRHISVPIEWKKKINIETRYI